MEQPTQTTSAPAANASVGELYVVQIIATGILIAALAVSYMHMVELFEGFGETGWRAYAIAATVDSLIVVGVLGGRAARARAVEVGTVVRLVLTVGIIGTVIGNVHHGIRANVSAGVFDDGLFNPAIDALGVATVIVGVLVSLWAPLAAELAYRTLLWAQDQLRAMRTTPAATADQVPAPAPAAPAAAEEPGPDPEPEPDPTEDQGDQEHEAPATPPVRDDLEAQVIRLYDRRRQTERVSERRLVELAETELGAKITRHMARKAIAQAKLAEQPGPRHGQLAMA